MNTDKIIELTKKRGLEVQGATDAQILAAEARIGFRFPDCLRIWLKHCNGSLAGQGGIFGVDQVNAFTDLEHKIRLYPDWLKSRWLPVAGDGCGNYYLLVPDSAVPGGFPVCF